MNNEQPSWLQQPIHPSLPAITRELALFGLILLVAVATRFYDLGTRVMSHDESLHTYFSWLLYKGQGYQHTPMMHGPWQFHWIALSYFLFGVSDFTARIPAALFSIASISLVWLWRRYLGSWGALVAAFLMVISPYLLFYGRYVREDVYTGFSGLLMLYAILRYLEAGERKHLFLLSGALIIHFADKETSFIYSAEILLFLGLLFLIQVTRRGWENNPSAYRAFVSLLAVGGLLLAAGLVSQVISHEASQAPSGAETAAPANPTGVGTAAAESAGGLPSIPSVLLEIGVLGIAAAGLIYFYLAYIRKTLPQNRSFDLMLLIFTFVLPQLTALVLESLRKLGLSNVVIPTDAASVQQLDGYSTTVMGIVLGLLFLITILVGQVWNREWWKYAVLFWGVFAILYTTFFTNAAGFFTGVVDSLGYWLVQQGVERGSQPVYYYLLVQIPMYEYLPAIGFLTGVVLGLKKLLQPTSAPELETDSLEDAALAEPAPRPTGEEQFWIFFALLVWWSLASIAAFSIAGERMPWLTVHMAWPMILVTGWAVQQIMEGLQPKLAGYATWRGLLSIAVLVIALLAAFNAARALFGTTPPFQGSELAQLQATSAFLLPLLSALGAGALLVYLAREDLSSLAVIGLSLLTFILLGSSVIAGASYLSLAATPVDPALLGSDRLRFLAVLIGLLASVGGLVWIGRLERPSPLVGLFTLTVFGLLTLQTIRTAFRAAYINYNNATEYMVYAHGATGVKEVMAQVEELSKRTAGGLNAVVAYDASAPDTGVSWPMVWYLRDFTALRSFDQPTRALREAVAVIVDQKNFDKIEGALGDGFYRFDYIRMWWPNQDYFGLDQARILNALADPALRQGIFDIWFNRDYTRYAQATGSSSMTLTTWSPADQMRLYIRKDVAAQIWNYGVGPSTAPSAEDPYEKGVLALAAEGIYSADQFVPALNAPRGVAAGLDGDVYVADSRNHRILHLGPDGSLLQAWGSNAIIDYSQPVTSEQGLIQAPLGTFNEPWGVAVGPDGSVYVTDTWNHRVQKFTAEGKPLKAWGTYGQPTIDNPATASSMWGPRGIAVDSRGRVLVADTGNKRIVVFDENGNYVTEFGSGGFDPGQFDEPVGVAVAPDGTVYVTDTWNQRVQGFTASETGDFFIPTLQWDVSGWFGQSLDNKPFLAVDANGNVYITDPEGFRVIEFTATGQFIRTWGAFGSGPEELGLPSGISVDPQGLVWVTDAGNNRILRYRLP